MPGSTAAVITMGTWAAIPPIDTVGTPGVMATPGLTLTRWPAAASCMVTSTAAGWSTLLRASVPTQRWEWYIVIICYNVSCHQDDDHEDSGLCPELIRAMEGVKYIAEVTRIVEDSNKVEWFVACFSFLIFVLVVARFPLSDLISSHFKGKVKIIFACRPAKCGNLSRECQLQSLVWCLPSDICFLDNLFSLTCTTISDVTPDCAGIVVMKRATRLENN